MLIFVFLEIFLFFVAEVYEDDSQVCTQPKCQVLNPQLFCGKFQLFSLVPLLTESDILRIPIEVQLFFILFLLQDLFVLTKTVYLY